MHFFNIRFICGFLKIHQYIQFSLVIFLYFYIDNKNQSLLNFDLQIQDSRKRHLLFNSNTI